MLACGGIFMFLLLEYLSNVHFMVSDGINDFEQPVTTLYHLLHH